MFLDAFCTTSNEAGVRCEMSELLCYHIEFTASRMSALGQKQTFSDSLPNVCFGGYSGHRQGNPKFIFLFFQGRSPSWETQDGLIRVPEIYAFATCCETQNTKAGF